MSQSEATPVDPATLDTWMKEGKIVLIDVREADEFAQERIPGARLAPLSTLDPARLLPEREHHVVLHCLAGGRSARAFHLLTAAGFDRLHHLHGGLIAWKAAGLPTETGSR